MGAVGIPQLDRLDAYFTVSCFGRAGTSRRGGSFRVPEGWGDGI